MADKNPTSTTSGSVGGSSTLSIVVTYNKTASLDINVGILPLDSAATATTNAADSALALDRSKTASIDINVGVIELESTATADVSADDSFLALDQAVTASLDVLMGLHVDATATADAGADDSFLALDQTVTTSLDVLVGLIQLESTATADVSSDDSFLALDQTVTASLDVLMGLHIDATATADAGSDDSFLALDQTATTSLDVLVGLIQLESTATTDVDADGSFLALDQTVTTSLDVLMGLHLDATATADVDADGSFLALDQTVTASLDVLMGLHLDATGTAGVGADDSFLALDQTVAASLDVLMGLHIDATAAAGADADDSFLAVEHTKTTSLDVLMGLHLDATATADVDADASFLALDQTVTTSLDVLIGLLLDATATAGVAADDSFLALDQKKTASLDVSIGVISLDATATADVNADDSFLALDQQKTASLDIIIGIIVLDASPSATADASDSILAIVRTLSSLLDINVGELPLYSTTDGTVTGSCTLAIERPIDSTTAGTVTGQAAIRFVHDVTTDLSITIKGTELRTGDLDVAIAQTEMIMAGLDLAVAETYTVTTSLELLIALEHEYEIDADVNVSPTRECEIPTSVTIKGTVTPTAQLSCAIFGTQLLTPQLDMLVELRQPYSLMKVWGDVASRYFGGTASDANFPENFLVAPAAVIHNDIGLFSAGSRRFHYQASNEIPTSINYDKYAVPLDTSGTVQTVGFRLLVGLHFLSFGPNNIMLFGVTDGTNSLVDDIAAGDLLGLAIEAEDTHVHFRFYAGTFREREMSSVEIERLIDRPLLVEIDTIAATTGLATYRYRLFDRTESFDIPVFETTLESSTHPTATHVAFGSLGRKSAELPTAQDDMHVHVDYIDVEPGTGAVYEPPYYLRKSANAHWRRYEDRPPLLLPRTGQMLLQDSLGTDAGYWRLDSSVGVSNISFTGSSALVTGMVIAEPGGHDDWENYRVSVDVRDTATVIEPSWFGVALNWSGRLNVDGSGIIAGLRLSDNRAVRLDVINGAKTWTNVGFPGRLELDRTYRIALDVRHDGTETIYNFYVDDRFIFSRTRTGEATAGTVALFVPSAHSSPVEFSNLVVRSGQNHVFVALSDDMVAESSTQRDTLFVDETDPIITVHSLTADSPVIVPYTTNPPVIKGSTNPGFDNVQLEWSATHVGVWTLRVDSTGSTDGTELQSGTYQVINQHVITTWSFADLPQTDGRYDVTLYLIADSGKSTAKRLGEYLLP